MACISYRQAVEPMVGEHGCEGDGYGFVQIEFDRMAGVIC